MGRKSLIRSLLTALLGTVGFEVAAAQNGVGLPVARAQVQSALAQAATADQAPFRVGRDPMPALILGEELENRGPRGSCEVAKSDLCYDLAQGRVVYRRARAYMPKIDGLTAESVSLRRDRIVFKYSF